MWPTGLEMRTRAYEEQQQRKAELETRCLDTEEGALAMAAEVKQVLDMPEMKRNASSVSRTAWRIMGGCLNESAPPIPSALWFSSTSRGHT